MNAITALTKERGATSAGLVAIAASTSIARELTARVQAQRFVLRAVGAMLAPLSAVTHSATVVMKDAIPLIYAVPVETALKTAVNAQLAM